MKKIFLLATLILSTTFSAFAESSDVKAAANEAANNIKNAMTKEAIKAAPKYIGIRIGGGAEVSYQQVINNKNFLEVDLGLSGWGEIGVIVTGVYNFVLANPTWTPGTWTWYAGAGATAGVGFTPKVDDVNVILPYAIVGLTGQMGLSYQFENIPLQLSADIRPTLGLRTYPLGFYGTGSILSAISPAISVRYAF